MKRVVTNKEIAILHYFKDNGWEELAEKYFEYLTCQIGIPQMYERKYGVIDIEGAKKHLIYPLTEKQSYRGFIEASIHFQQDLAIQTLGIPKKLLNYENT